MRIDGLQSNIPIGLLLDLEEGPEWSKAGDAERWVIGEYCRYATAWGPAISIERGLAPEEQQEG